MSEKILVPALGESITEATVAKWLKNAGDPVEADEPVVELETDKVNLEVPSPITGVLSEINEKDNKIGCGRHQSKRVDSGGEMDLRYEIRCWIRYDTQNLHISWR